MLARISAALLLSLSLVLPAAAAETPPDQMLAQLSDRMLSQVRAEREVIDQRPQRLFEIVEETLGPKVDFPRMARWVLGKYWRQATPEQQERFMTAFRDLLVRFYTSALLNDPDQLDSLLEKPGELIVFPPMRGVGDAETTTVRSEVHLPNGTVVPVNFSVHRKGGEWMIYDVNVEGISLITNYRNSFASEIRESGLENLIRRLTERSNELLEKAERRSAAASPEDAAVAAR